MTNGSILDVAIMKDGKFGVDLVNDIEFLNNYWTATGAFNGENLQKNPKENITYKKKKRTRLLLLLKQDIGQQDINYL